MERSEIRGQPIRRRSLPDYAQRRSASSGLRSLASLHVVLLPRSGRFRGKRAARPALRVAREADELDAVDPGLARLEDAANRGAGRAHRLAGSVATIAGDDHVAYGVSIAVAQRQL